MDKDFSRQFTQCPCCGSEDRFFGQLGDELKERGLAREEWDMLLDTKQGVVVDPTKQAAIPIGSELPGYGFKTDICIDCGCVYAIDITRIDMKKSLPPASQMPPNRAQRRRDDRQGGSGLVGPIGNN